MTRSRRPARLPGISILRPAATVPAFIESALVPPRAGLRGEAAIRQMAEDMRTAAQAGSGITESDLRALGWDKPQIALHSADAVLKADAMRGAA